MELELKRVFTSYQAQFIEEFLAPLSPKHHWLSAPAGSGLAQCAVGIIAALKTAKPEARVLLLTPRMLVLQWFRRLDAAVDSSLLLEGNRRNLRQLGGSARQSDFTWPAGHVVIMESWFAERFPDLEDSVFKTPWDLVIWDGFHLSTVGANTQRINLLERFGGTPNIDRMLLLSHNLRPGQDALDLPWLKKTTWDRSSLDSEERAMRRFEWHESPVLYRRSEPETELERALSGFVERWRAGSTGISPVERLLGAWESSPLALQEYLQRLRPSKASLVLRQSTQTEEEDDSDEPEDTPQRRESSDAGRRAAEAAELLDLVDGLTVDSKLEALQRYLEAEKDKGDSHVVVECRFGATARYLRAALGEIGLRIHIATAEMPSQEILATLSEFENSGGILITTSAALQGVELAADSVVAYDYVGPWMRSGLRPRVKPKRPELPLRILYLVDENRAADFSGGREYRRDSGT